jgi:isocitrate lyase
MEQEQGIKMRDFSINKYGIDFHIVVKKDETIAFTVDDHCDRKFVGIAKRNPSDDYSMKVGVHLAIKRCLAQRNSFWIKFYQDRLDHAKKVHVLMMDREDEILKVAGYDSKNGHMGMVWKGEKI